MLQRTRHSQCSNHLLATAAASATAASSQLVNVDDACDVHVLLCHRFFLR